jgi:hypothetical protein
MSSLDAQIERKVLERLGEIESKGGQAIDISIEVKVRWRHRTEVLPGSDGALWGYPLHINVVREIG